MPAFNPTIVLLVMLSAGILGSTRLGLRLVKSRAVLGAGLLALWAAFLANTVASSDAQGVVMFGWFDEHQILSEFQRLQLLSLSINVLVPSFLLRAILAVLLRAVWGERGLGGQISTALRFVAQLPQNLTAFLFGGVSDTPHGPPSYAFAMSAALAG